MTEDGKDIRDCILNPNEFTLSDVMDKIKAGLSREDVANLEIMGRQCREQPELAFQYLVHTLNNQTRALTQLAEFLGARFVNRVEKKETVN